MVEDNQSGAHGISTTRWGIQHAGTEPDRFWGGSSQGEAQKTVKLIIISALAGCMSEGCGKCDGPVRICRILLLSTASIRPFWEPWLGYGLLSTWQKVSC